MQHVGERLGCAKSVLKEMVDDLKNTKWTAPPKDTVQKSKKVTEPIVEREHEEEEATVKAEITQALETTISSTSGAFKNGGL